MYQNFLTKTALLLLTLVCAVCQKAVSQEKLPVTFGKITPLDFELPKSSLIDSSTGAVVIAHVGSIDFAGDKKFNGFDYVYKLTTRIKIIDKNKAADLGTVAVEIAGKNSFDSKFDEFYASTYNLDGGIVKETKVNEKDIFNSKINKFLDRKVFTMPDIKDGSIIEYSWAFRSSETDILPRWEFQFLNYPCLYSEFKFAIPDVEKYLITRYGSDSFYNVKSATVYTVFNMESVNAATDVHTHTWIMKNIPGFKSENHMYQPSNYLDRFEFTHAQFYNNDEIQNIATDWKNTEDLLLGSQAFGFPILYDNTINLKPTVEKICSPGGDDLKAAKEIYRYVRDNFACKPDQSIYASHNLFDVNKTRSGTVADLNLLLTALMRQRGLTADPVILATRSYGKCPETYPIVDNLNYVICMITYAGQKIFLDASDPQMVFGRIPLECYNGNAKIIDPHHSGSVYFYPTDIKAPKISSVVLVNNDKEAGENGSFHCIPSFYKAVELRSSLKEIQGKEKYLQEVKKKYGPDVEVSNLQIDSLDRVDDPLAVNYDLNYKTGFDGDVIYFNPVLDADFTENPFKTAERKYPVEFEYPVDDTYDLTMDIPSGYRIDDLPKSVQANFNGTDGMYLYRITKDDYTVQLHLELKINKAVFAPEDYTSLRDFFAMIMKKQGEEVVFKKK